MTTGTVRFKALFPNESNELFPNQFVNVKLLVDSRRDATVIPSSAIQRGPRGAFVYVVSPDGKAQIKPVVIGEIQGGEASIREGVVPGEMVVSDGTERLRDGSRVELRSASGPSQGVDRGNLPGRVQTPGQRPSAGGSARRAN